MTCPSCGAENAPDRLVCASCGDELAPEASDTPFTQKPTEEIKRPFKPPTPPSEGPPPSIGFGAQETAEHDAPPARVPNLALNKGKTAASEEPATLDDDAPSVPDGAPVDPDEEAPGDASQTDPWNPRHAEPSRGEVPDFLGKRFELIELLGEGGMAQVYHARDLKLGEEIAVKMVRSGGMGTAEDVSRFKREILAARRISHPNVIRIHDFGEDGEEAFISMELLTGGTLSERIEDGKIPVEQAIDIAIGVAEGLSAAHDQQIIHRDLKPDNILFNEDGIPKIVDFGIARLSSGEHTQTLGGFRGTPYYMSPEQADGREVTARSDVYSLGVVLYELFTGKRPFVSESLAKLAMMHVKDRAPRLRSLRPELPRAVEEIVMRSLEKRPERRYPDASAVANDLRKVRTALATGKLDFSVARPRGGRSLRIMAAAGVALLIAGAGYLAYSQLGPGSGRAQGTDTPLAAATGTPNRGARPGVTPRARATTMRTARPRSSPVRTRARPVATRAATATRKPLGASGTLSVKAAPWAKVYVNGKRVALETPYSKPYPPGKYRVRLVHPGMKFDKTLYVEVKEGGVTEVWADTRKGRMTSKTRRK